MDTQVYSANELRGLAKARIATLEHELGELQSMVGPSPTAATTSTHKPKRTMSLVARKAISRTMKARWAKAKDANKDA